VEAAAGNPGLLVLAAPKAWAVAGAVAGVAAAVVAVVVVADNPTQRSSRNRVQFQCVDESLLVQVWRIGVWRNCRQ